MCTALKVHASASTHVLQFLARGRGWGGHISVQTRFNAGYDAQVADLCGKLRVDSSLRVGEAGR